MSDMNAIRWDRTKRVLRIEEKMPEQSAAALAKFTLVNPHWRGAHWADCLDVLDDSDANLDVTEPIHDELRDLVPMIGVQFIGLVALTLYWAEAVTTPGEVLLWVTKVIS